MSEIQVQSLPGSTKLLPFFCHSGQKPKYSYRSCVLFGGCPVSEANLCRMAPCILGDGGASSWKMHITDTSFPESLASRCGLGLRHDNILFQGLVFGVRLLKSRGYEENLLGHHYASTMDFSKGGAMVENGIQGLVSQPQKVRAVCSDNSQLMAEAIRFIWARTSGRFWSQLSQTPSSVLIIPLT